jgi:hypothetical protein
MYGGHYDTIVIDYIILLGTINEIRKPSGGDVPGIQQAEYECPP